MLAAVVLALMAGCREKDGERADGFIYVLE